MVTLFPPISTVCEPATVKPPSKSADSANVGVPVTVIVSPLALPKVMFPFKVVAPDTVKLSEKVAALVTPNVPAILVLPSPLVTVNLFVLIVKLPVTAAEPRVAAPETSNAPFRSTSFPISTSSLPFVVINLRYEVPPSFISKAAPSLSGSVKDVACCCKFHSPPCCTTN